MTQQSGAPKIVNLSGGLYRSATPTQIPEISLSDMKNFDIEDNGLKTRKGMKWANSAPFYPGCLQFGYSQTLRTHYLKTTGGDYGPESPLATTQSKWGMWFYAKEMTATTERRDLFNLQDTSGNVLLSLYFGLDNRLHCNLRPNSGESLQDVADGAGGEQALRTATTHLYGVSLINDIANTIEVTLYDWTGAQTVVSKSYSSSNWSTLDTMIVGCDENTTYPDTDWTNASNNAFNGYVGEVVMAGALNTDIVKYFNEMHRAPGETVPDNLRIAHYPLQKNGEDAYGNNPTFPLEIYRTGGGLSNYSIKDSAVYTGTSESRDILFNTKSWEVDTYGVNDHVFAKTESLCERYRNYLNKAGTDYCFTMDVLPVKTGTGTYTILEATTAGPHVEISKSSAGTSTITYGHKLNSDNDVEIEYDIDNNIVSKLSFEYRHNTAQNIASLRMYHDTMKVATTAPAYVASTAAATVGNLRLGTADVTSISANLFISGLVFHNTNAASTWGKKPRESLANVTTYTTVPGEVFGILGQFTTAPSVISAEAVERTSSEMGSSIFDLHKYSAVKGLWLFTETTGYDYASTTTPHGVLINAKSTSTTDNTDLIFGNNHTPVWVADRFADAGLATTDHLDAVYEDEADTVLNYTPVNPNLGSRVFVGRNGKMIDTRGNRFSLGDTYSYNSRLSAKVRGFMYGNSLYFHNDELYLRFNGNEIRPAEVITPIIPLTLSKNTTPASGLNGTYKYTYTYVDKAGFESYPAIPTSTTIYTGNIELALNSRIVTQGYLNEQVKSINVYRNKGGTTSTTNLGRDADKSLYLLKTIPLSAVQGNVSTTLFTDNTADYALGVNPPAPGMADPMPNSKYSAIFKDTLIFTGNSLAPNHFYQSAGQTPETLAAFDEFLTESGEHNTGVAAVGAGFIIFKENSRLFVRQGIGGEKYEYHNGGCMAHDTLVTVGQRVIGLGSNGFFMTDGHQYDDITSVKGDGRILSSINLDVDTWSSETKRNARAAYHAPTERYICHVDSKYYIYDMRYRAWTKYEDTLGYPFVYDNEFYQYSKGWLLKELSTQSYVGTTRNIHSVSSGGVGKVQIVTTTSLPSTSAYGLPVYVGTSYYTTTAISNTSTTFDVYLATTKDFTNAANFSLGAMNCFADTKYFQMRTPNRNKIFKRFLCEHGNTEDGEIKVRIARNQGDFNRGYSHYVADTDIEKINTVLRVRSENMAMEVAVEDGKEHTIRNYSVVYDQESVQ